MIWCKAEHSDLLVEALWYMIKDILIINDFAHLTDQNISFVTRLRPIKPDVEKGYSNSCIRIPSTLILLVSSACADCSQWP